MAARKITNKDALICDLLQDPHWKVTATGQLLTRIVARGNGVGPWRPAGWVSPSRAGSKIYRRVRYKGCDLYVHRIVWAARCGKLDSYKTINHKDMNGLNNSPANLELVTMSLNVLHAHRFYRRTGMSAAEARAGWARGAGNNNGKGHHAAAD